MYKNDRVCNYNDKFSTHRIFFRGGVKFFRKICENLVLNRRFRKKFRKIALKIEKSYQKKVAKIGSGGFDFRAGGLVHFVLSGVCPPKPWQADYFTCCKCSISSRHSTFKLYYEGMFIVQLMIYGPFILTYTIGQS